jgi:hypothetical protein
MLTSEVLAPILRVSVQRWELPFAQCHPRRRLRIGLRSRPYFGSSSSNTAWQRTVIPDGRPPSIFKASVGARTRGRIAPVTFNDASLFSVAKSDKATEGSVAVSTIDLRAFERNGSEQVVRRTDADRYPALSLTPGHPGRQGRRAKRFRCLSALGLRNLRSLAFLALPSALICRNYRSDSMLLAS